MSTRSSTTPLPHQDRPAGVPNDDARPPVPPSAPAGIVTPRAQRFVERHATALLVVGSVATGAVLQHVAAPWLQQRLASPGVAARGSFPAPITLRGPNGFAVTLPMATPVVIQVWLQGCGDCMPAFEAHRELKAAGGLEPGLPVINVAYGHADPSWALQYGLGDGLVFDPAGAALVRPLGLNSFTTLIMDENGRIVLKDRPDNPGYADRMAGAIRALSAGLKTRR